MQEVSESRTQLPALAPADIDWQEGQPVSRRFGDIYFSRENGLEESRHIFLQQNRLAKRFESLPSGGAFIIAETGFGTGLNFLAAWQAWLSVRRAGNTVLHFVSVEGHPLTRRDLSRACALWPELEPLARQLLDQYPAPVSGLHRLSFCEGQVKLSLYFGDGTEALENMTFTADAWFLDGFAPARNPDLWTDRLARAVAGHSRPGTTLSTFTVAGAARQALSKAGFHLTRAPGYGSKREILTADFQPEAARCDPIAGANADEVTVIGAGVAGALLARNLAERGVRVTVLDSGSQPASGASGNGQGALYVKLGVDFNHQSQLSLAALLHSQRFYRQHFPGHYHRTGLLQMAWNEEESDRQRRFAARNTYPSEIVSLVDRNEARRLSGFTVPSGGLWYPDSGWLEPAKICSGLLDHPGIRLRTDFRVTRLMPCNGRWHVSGDGRQEVVSDQVVLCAGHESSRLLPVFGAFRFRTIRGQVTSIPAGSIRAPAAVICGSRYLNPPHQGSCLTGATFDLRNTSPDASLASHQENIDELENNLPGIWPAGKPFPEGLTGRVSFRCTTHDYQPAVGTLADQYGREIGGLHLFTGLGSKGLSWAPLLAEFLADRLTGQPEALPLSLSQRLAPDRCRAQERQKTA